MGPVELGKAMAEQDNMATSVLARSLSERPRPPFPLSFPGQETPPVEMAHADFGQRHEDASLAPPLPSIIEGLVRAVGRRRVTPTQAGPIGENEPCGHPRGACHDS